MITNADKLVAVLMRWGRPFVTYFVRDGLKGVGVVQAIEHKVRSTGWVSPTWSMAAELQPIADGVATAIVGPVIKRYLGAIDDNMIPAMAHGVVDEAIKQGRLVLLDGKIEIEAEDLEELKKYLDWNLPVDKEEVYQVITKDDERRNREN